MRRRNLQAVGERAKGIPEVAIPFTSPPGIRMISSRAACCISPLVLFTLIGTQAALSGPGRPAGGQVGKPDRPNPRIALDQFLLPNGLKVILHVDRKFPMVHINQWFHVGSKDEKPGKTGYAHLFEHLMFQGSKNASQKYFMLAEEAGANMFEAGVNGSTNVDRTNYYVTVPSGNLERLLWIESDRLATLHEALTKEKLTTQVDVVRNELRQGIENRHYGRAYRILRENLYPYGHPYAHETIGRHEDLAAATLTDAIEFFKSYYTPNNLSLVIAGDFDPAEAARLVRKYYGPIPPGPPITRPRRQVPVLGAEKLVEAGERVPHGRVYIAWNTPAYFDPGDAELDIAARILSSGLSSRLRKALVYDAPLASDVQAAQNSQEIAGMFVIHATARPGIPLPRIEQVITREINRLSKEGPSRPELDRAKAKLEYALVSGIEGLLGKANLINSYNTYFGSPHRLDADFARYRGATPESVRRAIAKWLDSPGRVVLRFLPETAGRQSEAALDRSIPPAFGTDSPFRAPKVDSLTLPNGLAVLVAERRDLPKVAITFATKAGAVRDPAGKEGLADLVTAVIKRGTKTRTAIEIEESIGDLGAAITGSAEREWASLSVQTLQNKVDAALAVLADVVRSPTFPEKEVEREKKIRIDALAQDSRNADAVSIRLLPMLGFGRDHPYGRPQSGLPESIRSLNSEDFDRFHRSYWKPGGSALIFAGAISLKEAAALANRLFGGWAGGKPPQISIPPPQPQGPGKVFLVNRPGASQTVVNQVLAAPRRTSPDYYPAQLLDAVWGGGFGTRLHLNLREEKGYTYGAYSNPISYSAFGYWQAYASVQNDKTAEAVMEFVKELKLIAGDKPVAQQELSYARANRIRGYAQRFESLARTAARIAETWAASLPMTDLQHAVTEFERVTLDSVNAAARKYLQLGASTLLIVGDLSSIEANIRRLNLGEVIHLDPEGRPIHPAPTASTAPPTQNLKANIH